MMHFPATTSIATIAAYFEHGIRAGIFDSNCAEDWAFSVVELQEQPPIEVIEIATAKGVADVLVALNNVPGERNIQLAGHWLLGHLRKQSDDSIQSLRQTIQQAMRISHST